MRPLLSQNGLASFGWIMLPEICLASCDAWWDDRFGTFPKAWFSLAMQAQAQAQAQAIGMTQVKMKIDANARRSKIIRTFRTV